MLIPLLNEIPCRSLADYMRSAKFEFVLKKNKAENRIFKGLKLSSCKLRQLLLSSHNLNNFHMGKTTFLHSCFKTIALRGRRYPTVAISYCSFSHVSWQVEHRHVQHIQKWCGEQHEAFGGIFAFEVISRKMDNSFWNNSKRLITNFYSI